MEDGTYRCFYVNQNNLLLGRSLLIANKEDMTEFQQRLDDLNTVELKTRERSSSKWKFLFSTNVTIFAALLKSDPVGCKNVLLTPNLVINEAMLTASLTSPTKNVTMATVACQGLCVCIKQETKGWRKRKRNHSTPISQPTHVSCLSVQNFRGFGLQDRDIVERLAEVNILVYDIEVLGGGNIGELAEQTLRRFNSKATLLGYNNHICYATVVNKVFKSFRCFTCNTFFTKSFNLQRHMPKCEELVKNIYPKSVYHHRETLFVTN